MIELYFNDKTYKLKSNILQESLKFLNEADEQQQEKIENALENIVSDKDSLKELLQKLNTDTSDKQDENNQKEIINQLNSIQQVISAFKIS